MRWLSSPSRASAAIPLDARSATMRDRWRRGGWPFALVAIVFAAVATQAIDLPGVYMDAVNPDYLVVNVLNPAHEPIVGWVLPGNFILGKRAPVLVALYHNSQTFWLGLPLFWLLGTTVESLRITHALLGLGVLAGLFYFLRRAALAPLACAAVGVVVALDPAFSYAFRTQSYITLAPSLWLLLGMGLTVAADPQRRRRWWLGGALAGFAASGYFIYGFFLLALAPAVLALTRSSAAPWRARGAWALGVLCGLWPHLLGYGLAIRKLGGLDEFLAFWGAQTSTLQAFGYSLSLYERAAFAAQALAGAVSNAWHHAGIFGVAQPLPGSAGKLALLLAVPLVLWIVAECRRTATAPLRLVTALPAAFFLVAMVFGGRLGGHHFIVLLPLLYAWLALSLRDALAGARTAQHTRAIAATATLAVLAVLNLAGQVGEARELRATGGAGLMSDAINRFADDLNALPSKPFVYAPDWGLALPVAFLTGGTVGVDSVTDFARARAKLCSGRDVAVALIKDREAQRDAWTRALAWGEPVINFYRQRDGATVFEVLLYRARNDAARCAASR